MTLMDAHAALNVSIEGKYWCTERQEWTDWLVPWADLRVDLARSMSAPKFADVVAGFNAGIEKVGKCQELDPTGTTTFHNPVTLGLMLSYLRFIEKAEQLTWRAAFPWWYRDWKWWFKRWKLPLSSLAKAGALTNLGNPKQVPHGVQTARRPASKAKRLLARLRSRK